MCVRFYMMWMCHAAMDAFVVLSVERLSTGGRVCVCVREAGPSADCYSPGLKVCFHNFAPLLIQFEV